MPSNTDSYGNYICWDSDPSINGTEVCDISESSPNPNSVSYNLYRQNPIGNYTLLASELSNNEYTDKGSAITG